MVVLQNCLVFVKDEPGSFSETCVTSSDGGSEEADTVFEEAIEIKEENVPEATEYPLIKAEHEVSIGVSAWQCLRVCKCGGEVCVWWEQHVLTGPSGATKREILKLRLTVSYFLLHCGFCSHFWNLVCNLEDRRLFGRHSYKWKDNIEVSWRNSF
jgi:hypothetical protein